MIATTHTPEPLQRVPATRAMARRCIARYTSHWHDTADPLRSVVGSAARRWSADGWGFDDPNNLWAMLRLIVRRKIWQQSRNRSAGATKDARSILAEEIAAVVSELPAEFACLLELKIRPLAPSDADAAQYLKVSAATVERMMQLLTERLSRRFRIIGASGAA